MAESSLEEFFTRNSHLFTVLGVFGAISVYFTQLEVESRWRRLGVVSSLTIFVLVAIAIHRNISPPDSDKSPFDFVVNKVLQRRDLLIFYVAFDAVVFSVTAIVLQFSETALFLFQFLFLLAGISVARWLVIQADPQIDETLVMGEDPEFVVYAGYLARNGMYALIIGCGILYLAWVQGLVPVDQLIDFQAPSLAVPLVVGFPLGLAVGGFLYVFSMLMAFLSHVVFWQYDDYEVFEPYSPLFRDSSEEEEMQD